MRVAGDKIETEIGKDVLIMRLYKNYIFDIVIAALAVVLGVVMIPPIGIGQYILNVLLAISLAAYLVIHLFGKLQRSRGTTFILTLIEFSIVCLIIVGLILQQFRVFNISGVCRTLGFVLWLRGMVSIIVMYITLGTVKSGRYNLPKFLLYLALITTGTYLFANPLITDYVFNWILCIVMMVVGLVFAGLAFLYSPSKKKKEK